MPISILFGRRVPPPPGTPIPSISSWLFAGASFLLASATISLGESASLTLEDAATIYFHNERGEPFQLHAEWASAASGGRLDPVVATLMAPDGRIIDRLEADLAETEQALTTWAPEITDAAKGTYRLLWTAFKGELRLATEPELPLAVTGHAEGFFVPEGESCHYFSVPPGMDEMVLFAGSSVRSAQILDQEGAELFAGKGGAEKIQVPTAGRSGEIWSIVTEAKGKERNLRFQGAAPVPLASSTEAAKAVGSGVTVVDDGILCFFPWQVGAWELLKEYRRLPAEAYHIELPVLQDFAEQWESEPSRNATLFGPEGAYANLKPILAMQNLDPKSPWFGSINVWREPGGTNERQTHPAQHFRREDAFGSDFRAAGETLFRRNNGGLGVHQALEAGNLATVYVLETKFNPLFKSTALLNRIIVAQLQDVMMVRPSGMLEPLSTGYYGGDRAFRFNRFMTTYGRVGRFLPPREKAVLDAAFQSVADRHMVGQVGLTVNQWTSIPHGLNHVYEGSGDERYREWTRRHIKWILAAGPVAEISKNTGAGGGFQAAAYLPESGGPDATYIGITLAELAYLAREAEDVELVESIRKIYHLFNHTIVPHPLGKNEIGLGASDFSHRTPGNWWRPQHGAGLTFMADLLPEAGLRTGLGYFERSGSPEALADFRRIFKYNPEDFFDSITGGSSRIGLGRQGAWKYYPTDPKDGLLPVEEEGEFFRNFGNEFFAIRRGDYYVMIYAGATMPKWMGSRAKIDVRQQYPQNGGGMSLLWSRQGGPSLLGRNLGAYAAHSLVAEKNEKEFKNDYWGTRVLSSDPEKWTLEIEGKMTGVPISYVRRYTFHAESIEIHLEISASEDVTLTSFREVLPLVQEGELPIQAREGEKSVNEQIRKNVAGIRLGSPHLAGSHILTFSPVRTASVRPVSGFSYLNRETKMMPLILDLPLAWGSGQKRTFTSRISFAEVGNL
jgi:hypothetical protein